jgi:hypothetical protein
LAFNQIGLTRFPTIEIYGKSFFEIKNVYLSASNENMFNGVTTFHPFSGIPRMEDMYPPFRGIPVPSFLLYNENYLTFELPQIPLQTGMIDVIVENEAGYGILTKDKQKPKLSAYDGALGLECKDCGVFGLNIS